MEKFSTWRDKGTGIAPFMPTERRLGALDYVAAVAKLPVFALLWLGLWVFPGSAIAAMWWLAGGVVDFSVDSVRKNKIAEINRHRPGPGSVVVANFASPLDLVAIFLASTARIGQISVIVPRKGELYELSFWEALRVPFVDPAETGSLPFGRKSADLAHLANKLVVIFPEGTTSNGQGTLPFVEAPEKLQIPKASYSTLVLRSPPAVAVPVPRSSWSYYCSVLAERLVVRIKAYPSEKLSGQSSRQIFLENGLSPTALSLGEKAEFWQAFHK